MTDIPVAKDVEGKSIGRIVWGRFVRHKAAMVAAVFLFLTIVVVITSIGVGPIPGWWKWEFDTITSVQNPRGAPTMGFIDGRFVIGDHPFGQDEIGRDIFARVMRGAQVSLLVMVLMGLIATGIGILVGALAGYYRGWLDNALMRMTEVIIAIPTLIVTAVIGKGLSGKSINFFGNEIGANSPMIFGIVLGLLLWPALARLVRAEYLSLREREFVDAARVAGAKDRTIMFQHILPNAMGVVIVNATLLMATATILESALSFLGFGIQAPNVSLGALINEYRSSFVTRPWLFYWPGFFIIVYALTINLIGDGLRDAFDPRQRRIPKVKDIRKRDGANGAEEAADVSVVDAGATAQADAGGKEQSK